METTIKINGKTMTVAEWVEEMVVPCEAVIVGVPESDFAGWMPPAVP